MGLDTKMNSIFVVCQHGGEKTPLKVIKDNFKEKLKYVIANGEALRKNKRFIDSDLNRSFPGSLYGNREEKIARHLVDKLKKYDHVLDLHTTSVKSPIFIITTKLDQEHFELINSLSIKRVVIMQGNIANGHSLIDHIKLGVSIEAGKEGSKEAYETYKKFINNYLNNRNIKRKEYYIVFGFIKRHKNEKLDKSIQSFKLVRRGEVISKINNKTRLADYDFYPILPGEKSYKEILTLTAKKIDLRKLKQIKDL